MKKGTRILPPDEMRAKKLRHLATRIVDHLMTVYCGRSPKRGTRLAIMRSDTFAGPEENLGGLCRRAAIERVIEVLAAGGKDGTK